MKEKHRIIRALLSSAKCPERAIDEIKAFHLRPDEELYIIEKEVYGKSIAQIADEHKISTDAVGKRRHAAFTKMADAMEYAREKKNR